jgi:hypothetical protein
MGVISGELSESRVMERPWTTVDSSKAVAKIKTSYQEERKEQEVQDI